MPKTLIVILGPTGVGKTDLSIRIAKHFNAEIASSDSRQVFKEMRIGTAVPSQEELSAVKHHFIHSRSIHDYYSSWEFEKECVSLLDDKFESIDNMLMVGGSMMYIDAVCKGIDDIPTIAAELRQELREKYEKEGLESLQEQLKELDPIFYDQVDLKNAKRVLHAVEVCIQAGKPYSSMRTNTIKERGFKIIRIGLNREREELYSRINLRVDQMLEQGLIEEAKSVYAYKEYNSLNTVGYKELFEHFDGNISLKESIRLIKRNSRRYAKRQVSWFRRDDDIHWFHPQDDADKIIEFLEQEINS